MTRLMTASSNSLHARRTRKLTNGARTGVAATELAVILPLLLLLVLAATDFGRIVHAYVVVSHGARAGAGYGSTHRFSAINRTSWETQIRQAVHRELAGLPEFNAANLQITIETTAESTDQVRVAVSVTYPFKTAVSWIGIPDEVQLAHRVEFRQYR